MDHEILKDRSPKMSRGLKGLEPIRSRAVQWSLSSFGENGTFTEHDQEARIAGEDHPGADIYSAIELLFFDPDAHEGYRTIQYTLETKGEKGDLAAECAVTVILYHKLMEWAEPDAIGQSTHDVAECLHDAGIPLKDGTLWIEVDEIKIHHFNGKEEAVLSPEERHEAETEALLHSIDGVLGEIKLAQEQNGEILWSEAWFDDHPEDPICGPTNIVVTWVKDRSTDTVLVLNRSYKKPSDYVLSTENEVGALAKSAQILLLDPRAIATLAQYILRNPPFHAQA